MCMSARLCSAHPETRTLLPLVLVLSNCVVLLCRLSPLFWHDSSMQTNRSLVLEVHMIISCVVSLPRSYPHRQFLFLVSYFGYCSRQLSRPGSAATTVNENANENKRTMKRKNERRTVSILPELNDMIWQIEHEPPNYTHQKKKPRNEERKSELSTGFKTSNSTHFVVGAESRTQ
jgi:hypothetical protein